MANYFVWVDIPVDNLERAMTFYSKVLNVQLEKAPEMEMSVFPHDGPGVGGCLYRSDEHKPSQAGPLAYLNVDGRIRSAVAAVTPNGGSVIEPVHSIGPHGFRAVIIDSEGNRLALHSQTDA